MSVSLLLSYRVLRCQGEKRRSPRPPLNRHVVLPPRPSPSLAHQFCARATRFRPPPPSGEVWVGGVGNESTRAARGARRRHNAALLPPSPAPLSFTMRLVIGLTSSSPTMRHTGSAPKSLPTAERGWRAKYLGAGGGGGGGGVGGGGARGGREGGVRLGSHRPERRGDGVSTRDASHVAADHARSCPPLSPPSPPSCPRT